VAPAVHQMISEKEDLSHLHQSYFIGWFFFSFLTFFFNLPVE